MGRLPAQRTLVEAGEGLSGIARGAHLVCDVLRHAYGPAGRPIAVQKASGRKTPSRDGYVLAGTVTAIDPMETIGVEEMKRLVSEMESAVGDGTKTAAFIACGMLACAAKAEASTMSGLVRGMERAVKAALGAIESQAQPVDTQLEQIASTAARIQSSVKYSRKRSTGWASTAL